jgi:cell division protein FtsZ
VKIQLGESLTEGRGAGNKPEKGRDSAIENIQDVIGVLEYNTKMVVITAGMGGGTGTGAAPIIAKTAKEMGILTVGIVTIPFRFEGMLRINQAIDGISEMEKYVDSLLIINNERLREMFGDLKLSNAFGKADNVLASAAKGIAEIITVHGYINVDFADVETVMKDSGVAIMGSGRAEGEFRAIDAIQSALESPLLNNNQINGAQNILLNITSGINEVTMDEVGQITDFVQETVGHSASIIWGTGNDTNLVDEVVVTIIATGFDYEDLVESVQQPQKKQVVRVELDQEGNIRSNSEPKYSSFKDVELDMADAPRVVNFDDLDKEKERKINKLYGYPEKPVSKSIPEDAFSVDTEIAPYVFTRRQNQESASVNPDDIMDEKYIEQLENVPAYKRRNLHIDDGESARKENQVSRFSLTDEGGGNSRISKGNAFLHDNVD